MSQSGGFVTTEFLFAVIIAFGMTLATFALTFTLSTVEIAQYIVYSSARAQAAGNMNIEAQKKSAQLKYETLSLKSSFSNLFQNGWFTLSKPADLEIRSGNGENFEKDYAGSDLAYDFQGVRATFTANVLEMQLPLLGKIQPDDDNGFRTRLTAFLIREPSMQECNDFMEARKEKLWDYDGAGRFTRFKKSDAPTPWEDNGC